MSSPHTAWHPIAHPRGMLPRRRVVRHELPMTTVGREQERQAHTTTSNVGPAQGRFHSSPAQVAPGSATTPETLRGCWATMSLGWGRRGTRNPIHHELRFLVAPHGARQHCRRHGPHDMWPSRTTSSLRRVSALLGRSFGHRHLLHKCAERFDMHAGPPNPIRCRTWYRQRSKHTARYGRRC